jgi:hypothetical protein
LADVVAGHGDLAFHHPDKVDYPPGETHVVVNESVHQNIKLAVYSRKFFIVHMELNGKNAWFSVQ